MPWPGSATTQSSGPPTYSYSSCSNKLVCISGGSVKPHLTDIAIFEKNETDTIIVLFQYLYLYFVFCEALPSSAVGGAIKKNSCCTGNCIIVITTSRSSATVQNCMQAYVYQIVFPVILRCFEAELHFITVITELYK